MSYYLNVDNIDNAWEVLMAELYSQKEDFCLDSRDGVVVGELLNACITIKDPTAASLNPVKEKCPPAMPLVSYYGICLAAIRWMILGYIPKYGKT